jgi:hypothetical protein
LARSQIAVPLALPVPRLFVRATQDIAGSLIATVTE